MVGAALADLDSCGRLWWSLAGLTEPRRRFSIEYCARWPYPHATCLRSWGRRSATLKGQIMAVKKATSATQKGVTLGKAAPSKAVATKTATKAATKTATKTAAKTPTGTGAKTPTGAAAKTVTGTATKTVTKTAATKATSMSS